jgi:hypothetical protein
MASNFPTVYTLIGLKEPLISLSRLFFLYVKLTKNIIKVKEIKRVAVFLLNFYCSNKFNGGPFYRSIFTVVINSLSL